MARKPKSKTPLIATLPDIERVPLATIRPYWRNARKNDRAVPGVIESIKRYGLNQPLVVDGKGVIIVGHTRYRALVELGVEEVPVVRPKLSKADAAEYRIADNKTAELAEWDQGLLIPELRGMDVDRMQLFFPDHNLGRMLAEASGSAYQPVTEDDMDRALSRQQSGMANLTRPKLTGQIQLECPGCGDTFFVDRATMDTHPGEKP